MFMLISSNINTFTPQAIAPQQTNNTKQRSPLISTKQRSPKSSTLSPTSDRPSTNQQHQTAIAPTLNQKAIASNIHTSTTQAIAPSTNQQHQNSDRP